MALTRNAFFIKLTCENMPIRGFTYRSHHVLWVVFVFSLSLIILVGSLVVARYGTAKPNNLSAATTTASVPDQLADFKKSIEDYSKENNNNVKVEVIKDTSTEKNRYSLSCHPNIGSLATLFKEHDIKSAYDPGFPITDLYSIQVRMLVDSSDGTQFLGGSLYNTSRLLHVRRDNLGLNLHPVIGSDWFFLARDLECALYHHG